MATLDQLRMHLRFSEDDHGLDEDMLRLLDAASAHLESLDIDMSEPIDPALSHAMILLAGYWFENTGGTEAGPPLAYGVNRLIAPFRGVSL